MSWPLALTFEQSDYLKLQLRLFYDKARVVGTYPEEYIFQLAVLNSMLERSIVLSDDEIPVLRWTLDQIVNEFPEGHYDELLETAYCKLFEKWPLYPPWYTRARGLEPPEDDPYR